VKRAVELGLIYFAVVFAAGVVIGTIRTLVLIPALGELVAVLVELPVILSIAWAACGRLLRDRRLTAAEAAAMVVAAFMLLMLGEAAVSRWLAGLTMAEHLALYAEPAHLVGLGGQLAFAAFPLLRRR
jgi:hypothetical protein